MRLKSPTAPLTLCTQFSLGESFARFLFFISPSTSPLHLLSIIILRQGHQDEHGEAGKEGRVVATSCFIHKTMFTLPEVTKLVKELPSAYVHIYCMRAAVNRQSPFSAIAGLLAVRGGGGIERV